MEYRLVSPSLVDEVWPHIAQWVDTARGVDHSFSIDDIKALCAAGQYDLWVVTRDSEYYGFLIGCLIPAPQFNVYCGAWLGGKDLARWVKDGIERIKAHARLLNCKAYFFIGREAWSRLLDIERDYKGTFYFINL